MDNTLNDGDKLLVTTFSNDVEYGDIIIISHGQHYSEPIVKRVIATEGQEVKIDYDKDIVTVDGVVLEEDYIAEADMSRTSEQIYDNVKVPEGMVFVMGDNRNHSLDSRSEEVGLIYEDDIVGKAEFIVFPFDRFSSLY